MLTQCGLLPHFGAVPASWKQQQRAVVAMPGAVVHSWASGLSLLARNSQLEMLVNTICCSEKVKGR